MQLAGGGGVIIHSTRREQAVDGVGVQGELPPAGAGRVLGQHRLQGSSVSGGRCALSEIKNKSRGTLLVVDLYIYMEVGPKNRARLLLTAVNMLEKN